MTDEKWTHWEPIEALTKRYEIVSVIDDGTDFSILLVENKNESKKIRLLFESLVETYRCAPESYRYKLIIELSEKYGGDFYRDKTFFKVENSSYVKWILEESCGISENRSLIHFAFITDNVILDLLAYKDPKIEFINDDNDDNKTDIRN